MEDIISIIADVFSVARFTLYVLILVAFIVGINFMHIQDPEMKLLGLGLVVISIASFIIKLVFDIRKYRKEN